MFTGKLGDDDVAIKQLILRKDARGNVDKKRKIEAFREFRVEILVRDGLGEGVW